MHEHALVGRSAELAVIERFLGADPGVLLIEGYPGIGKTSLLDAARRSAAAAGALVLSAQPTEAELPLGFAAVADLLEPVPPEVVESIPAPQRRALRVALLQEDPGEHPPDPRAAAAGVLSVLRRLAEHTKVVITIDDRQWLDAASAKALAFALRRLGTETVWTVMACRTDGADGSPLDDALDGLERVERLTLGGLSLGAIRQLVVDRVGFAGRRPELLRLQEISAGNPYFALELASAWSPADRLIRVPLTLGRLIRRRLARLPAPTRRLLLLSALASDPTSALLRTVAEPPEGTLEPAVEAGVIHWDDDRVVYGHPLVRSVVIGDATADARRAAHRRLAAAETEPSQCARHRALAAAGPNPEAAAAAEGAARLCWLRGATDAAAELGELAARLTPPGDQKGRRRRALHAAEYRFEAGDAGAACLLVDGVLDAFEPGPDRAAALLALTKFRRYRGDPFAEWEPVLHQALDEAGGDADVASAIHLHLGMAAGNTGNLGGAAEHAAAGLALAERSGNQVLRAQAAAGVAMTSFYRGEGVRRDLVDAALSVDVGTEHLPVELRPRYIVGAILRGADELDAARQAYEVEYGHLVDRGDDAGLALLLAPLVEVLAWTGDLDRAERLAEQGWEAAALANSPVPTALLSAARALVHTYRGRVEAARADAERAISMGDQAGLYQPSMYGRQVLGLLELSLGRPDDAHRVLAPLARVAVSAQAGPDMFRMVPDEVEALIRLGDLDAAAALLEPFTEAARRSVRLSSVAGAARCRALLLAARGDLDGAAAAIAEARSVHERLGMPLELARTRLAAGEIHRRARHKRVAKEHLDAALEICEGLGAPLWAARARDELGRLGLRSARAETSGLTAVERQVADLVAEGKTNAEVAGELFMAVRTVEAHLSRAYRKLGIRSRTELSRSLSGRAHGHDGG